jgi:hypothetical protein
MRCLNSHAKNSGFHKPESTVRVCRFPDRKSLKKSGYIPVK